MAPQQWLLFTIWKQNPGGTPYPVYYSSQFSMPVTYDTQCRQVTCQLMRSCKTNLPPVNDTMHTLHNTHMAQELVNIQNTPTPFQWLKMPSSRLVRTFWQFWSPCHENWMLVSTFCECACVVHSERSVGRVTASRRRSLPCNSTQPVIICFASVDESRGPHGTNGQFQHNSDRRN